ncbi:MAG: M14 family metallopeptidase, partial [Ilumatobacteraceae bacterium]|nr:M14 family metallopeptidase [Ilumatobacteraceae bacterium]
FRRAAELSGAATEAHPIEARGPSDERLTVDVARTGRADAERVLLVLSGVHGVEGFASAAIQCELLERIGADGAPDDAAIVLVHAVNPWGMAWWRRQNESNVDLNRNWARDRHDPPANDGYADLHHLLVPDGDEPPTPESLLDPLRTFIDRHGIGWVRDAISRGQYSHPDGLYFGGDRVEASTRILADIARRHLAGARRVLTVDLHTGHGAAGTYTLLSQARLGSPDDEWLRRHFDPDRIEATVDNPDATTPAKVGQLAIGLAELLPATEHHAVTFELGTVPNTRMILAERAEHWVHRHGDRTHPAHAALVWEHRICSTPDDPEWVATALAHGRTVLTAALSAFS